MNKFLYGTLIETVNIANLNIDIFSNGSDSFLSKDISTDSEGSYLGIKYQCVEFVRRYIYKKHKVNLANRWRRKDALDWFSNREKMNLISLDVKSSLPGDIITFTGGIYGHVGIIRCLKKDGIVICGQNLFNDRRDAGYLLSFENAERQNHTITSTPQGHIFQSVLRFTS